MDCYLNELRDIVAPIAERYGIKRVSLFGSRSRGNYRKESDYDFCIVPGKRMTLTDLSNFHQDLAEALGTKVDIVYENSLSPEFLSSISADIKIIYETEN